jgi:hypothetical protein
MQIDESEEQYANAYSSMDESLERDSNVTVERDLHPEKQYLPSVSTDEGMQIDESEEQYANAYSSMDESLEPDSNVTVERDLHPEKQYLPSVSTDEGMQIDESDEQKQNARSPIDESREPDSNVTLKRDCHLPKQLPPSLSIEKGMQSLPETSVLPFSVTQPPRSTTSIRIPPCETQFRGKTHPDDLEQSQNAFLPSVL